MRIFESYRTLWRSLLAYEAGEGDTCEHEEKFIAYFEKNSGPAGAAWEVLEISSSVPAFLVNVSESLLSKELIADMRDLLNATLPGFAVLLHVFDGEISFPPSVCVAAVAVIADNLWMWGDPSRLA